MICPEMEILYFGNSVNILYITYVHYIKWHLETVNHKARVNFAKAAKKSS